MCHGGLESLLQVHVSTVRSYSVIQTFSIHKTKQNKVDTYLYLTECMPNVLYVNLVSLHFNI